MKKRIKSLVSSIILASFMLSSFGVTVNAATEFVPSPILLWDMGAAAQKGGGVSDGEFNQLSVYDKSSNFFNNSNPKTGIGSDISPLSLGSGVWGIGAGSSPGNFSLETVSGDGAQYPASDFLNGTAVSFSNVYKIIGSTNGGASHGLYQYKQLPTIGEGGQDYLLSIWLRHVKGTLATGNGQATSLAVSYTAGVPDQFNVGKLSNYYFNNSGFGGIFGANTGSGAANPGKWQLYQSVIRLPQEASEKYFMFSVRCQGMLAGAEIDVADPMLVPISLLKVKATSAKTFVDFTLNENSLDLNAEIQEAAGSALFSTWEVFGDESCTAAAPTGVTFTDASTAAAVLNFDKDADSSLYSSGSVYVRAKLNDGSLSNVLKVTYSGLDKTFEITEDLPETISVPRGSYLSFPMSAEANYSTGFNWTLSAGGISEKIYISPATGENVSLIIDNRDGSLTDATVTANVSDTYNTISDSTSAALTIASDALSNIRLADGYVKESSGLNADNPMNYDKYSSYGVVSGDVSGGNLHTPMIQGSDLKTVTAAADYELDKWIVHSAKPAFFTGGNSMTGAFSDDASPIPGASVLSFNVVCNKPMDMPTSGVFQRTLATGASRADYLYVSGWVKLKTGTAEGLKATDDNSRKNVPPLLFGIFNTEKQLPTGGGLGAAYYAVPITDIIGDNNDWHKFEYVIPMPKIYPGTETTDYYVDTRFMYWNGIGEISQSFELQFSDFKAMPFEPNELFIHSVAENSDNTVTVKLSNPLPNADTKVFVALYKNQTLYDVEIITVDNTLDAGHSIVLPFEDLTGVNKIKAMLWNGSYQPLWRAKTN